MDNSCGSSECSARDLRQRTAWLFWYVPILLVIVGSNWSRGRVWLWIPAFLAMGVGCLANAARYGRTHCYITAPLFLLAAGFVALSALGVVTSCVAAELPRLSTTVGKPCRHDVPESGIVGIWLPCEEVVSTPSRSVPHRRFRRVLFGTVCRQPHPPNSGIQSHALGQRQ